MEWAGDLLRFFFSIIADEMPPRPNTLGAEVPRAPEAPAAQSSQVTAQDDVDDDVNLYTENQQEFLRLEAQLPLVFPYVYDFGSRNPSLGSSAQEKVKEQLSFVNREVSGHLSKITYHTVLN